MHQPLTIISTKTHFLLVAKSTSEVPGARSTQQAQSTTETSTQAPSTTETSTQTERTTTETSTQEKSTTESSTQPQTTTHTYTTASSIGRLLMSHCK